MNPTLFESQMRHTFDRSISFSHKLEQPLKEFLFFQVFSSQFFPKASKRFVLLNLKKNDITIINGMGHDGGLHPKTFLQVLNTMKTESFSRKKHFLETQGDYRSTI